MKKKMTILLALLLLLTGCGPQSGVVQTRTAETQATESRMAKTRAAETQETENLPSETEIVISETVQAYLTSYRPVLELYAQAQAEQWDGQQFTAAGLSNQAFGWLSIQQKLGCGLVDLDADGVMELLIGDCESSLLVDGYRLNNGIPEQLFMAVTKLDQPQYEDLDFLYDEWDLCRDHTGAWYLFHQVQQAWLICGYFPVWLEQGILRVTEGFVYNSIVDEFNPWYRVDGYILDYAKGEQVASREDADMAVYNHECARVSLNSLENSWMIADLMQ